MHNYFFSMGSYQLFKSIHRFFVEALYINKIINYLYWFFFYIKKFL